MKNKRWTYVTVIAFLTLMSCSLNICGYRQGYEREQLGDTDWIAQAGDSYTFWRRNGTVTPHGASLQFSRFFGKETLWTLEVKKEGYLSIACTINSSQGPFEVVLVHTSTKKVIRIANQQGRVERRYYLEKGIYTIKILGYNASGSVGVTLNHPLGITSSVSTMQF